MSHYDDEKTREILTAAARDAKAALEDIGIDLGNNTVVRVLVEGDLDETTCVTCLGISEDTPLDDDVMALIRSTYGLCVSKIERHNAASGESRDPLAYFFAQLGRSIYESGFGTSEAVRDAATGAVLPVLQMDLPEENPLHSMMSVLKQLQSGEVSSDDLGELLSGLDEPPH